MSIYLDNAATTPIDPQVADAMMPFISGKFGNPSSTHGHGREVKSAIELARKSIAETLNCTPGEIYFTSGGTESINCILNGAVNDLGIKHAVTSPIEHHAVLHTLEHLADLGKIKLDLVKIDSDGHIDYEHLEHLLENNTKSMVSLMHCNNEIGNVNDIGKIADLCTSHNAFFHSDTVQAMGHFAIDLKETKVDAVVCSAHKIHGPKGVGFMFIRKNHKMHSMILGGGQERNMRGGTENVIGIVGLAKAFEIATSEMEAQKEHILGLKTRMIDNLRSSVPGVSFNGDSASEESLYTVLNVCIPPFENQDMILFQLDLAGISASGGSACNSGATKGSHVLEALGSDPARSAIRFSFSKHNTQKEIDQASAVLAEMVTGGSAG